MRKCSISFAIKEMQIKTWRFHFTPDSYYQENKQQMLVKVQEKWNPNTADGNVNQPIHYGNQYEDSS
jgi:hypothetical protein